MIGEPTPIEHNLTNTSLNGSFGKQLPDLPRGVLIPTNATRAGNL
jgi:hypothetical protein